MPFLPEEIITKIFRFLPDRIVHDVMCLFCLTWRKVISDPDFIKAHLLQSSYNFPIRFQRIYGYIKSGFELYYVNKDNTTWNLKKKINKAYLADGVGLILTVDWDDQSNLCLLNPVTNQIVTISHPPIKNPSSFVNWAVGYSPSDSKYKVVYKSSSGLVYIWTVGVDKDWRKVYIKPEIMTAMDDVNNVDICYSPQRLCNRPVGICGLVYWYYCHNGYLIVLDLEEEIFYEVNSIEESEGIKGYKSQYIVKSGSMLCIAAKHIYWQFWELVDYKNGGEWRKLGSLDIKSKLIVNNNFTGLPHNDWCSIFPDFITRDELTFSCYTSGRLFSYNFKSAEVSWSFKYQSPMKLILTNSSLVL